MGAIRPFLFNLFRDRDIIKIPGGILTQSIFAYIVSALRARKVRPFYEMIGGGSPLNTITRTQGDTLEKMLNERGKEIFSVHVGMRYWYPFTKEAVWEVKDREPAHIVALPLYPQYSRATTGSSFNDLERILERERITVPLIKVAEYHDHPSYIASWREQLSLAMKEREEGKKVILFSAHGLPKSVVEEGDPYLRQVEETVSEIMKGFPGTAHYLSFQSRAGRDWLEPGTDQMIARVRDEGFDTILMVPVSFVSDHIETLYEIDILYREMAESMGLTFVRVPSLNDSTSFIEALRDIVESALTSKGDEN